MLVAIVAVVKMLNHFVYEQGEDLVNLTTKKILPKTSSPQELRENFFLEGQEKDAINYFLFGRQKTTFSIDLIPTWECNLRCNHCFVLHELVKKDPKEVNQDQLVDFVTRLCRENPSIKNGSIKFIGGEPTLRSEQNVEIIKKLSQIPDLKIMFKCTSNGTKHDENSIKFFELLDAFTISVDGPKHIHNLQRKSIDGSEDPFESTLQTIRKLVSVGLRDKLFVQLSLNEEFMTKENLIEYYKTMLMCGVKFKNIIVGFVCPTKHNPELDEEFIKVHRKPRVRQCCKYRHMVNFVVDTSNNVFCDYFDASNNNLLGKLSDPISQIAKNHERIIRESFSVLNDPKCQKCPVIGLCWGWCANTKGINPSDHCDQTSLLEKVRINAGQNNLIRFMKNSSNDVSKTNIDKTAI